GQGHPEEMVKSGVYGKSRPPPHRRRHTSRGHHLTRSRQYDVGRPGKEGKSTHPKSIRERDSGKGQVRPVRRRLHCHSSLQRAARTRSQTPGGSLHERTRVRTLKRENLHYPY